MGITHKIRFMQKLFGKRLCVLQELKKPEYFVL